MAEKFDPNRIELDVLSFDLANLQGEHDSGDRQDVECFGNKLLLGAAAILDVFHEAAFGGEDICSERLRLSRALYGVSALVTIGAGLTKAAFHAAEWKSRTPEGRK
jgi:hypothetical protein